MQKKFLTLISLLLAALFYVPAYAQSRKTLTTADSLQQNIKLAKSDSSLMGIYHKLYAVTDSLIYARKELSLSDTLHDIKGHAQACLDIGRYFYFFTDYHDSALAYLKQAVGLGEQHGYLPILANAYRYMGFLYRATDSYTAETYYEKSLQICDKLHNQLLASYDYSALGNIYEAMRTNLSNKTALVFYLKSLNIREKMGSYEEKASSLLETSRIYELTGDFNKAFSLRTQGLELAEQAQDVTNTIYLSHVLGCDYTDLFHDNKKSLEYQMKAYNLARTQKGDYEILAQITRSLGTEYATVGDYKQSSEYYNMAHVYIDSMNTHTNNEIYNVSAEKHNLEVELEREKSRVQSAEVAARKSETERQMVLRNALLVGFGLVFVIAGILYNSYRRKNITNKRLALANIKLEEAHHDITDSINYASNIQKTILVPKEKIEEKLNEVFILNMPKDIVSGDFYYYAEVDDQVVIAACDCTGHGVPGAIVSIFCSNALHRAVKRFHIQETGQILDKVRELVIEDFGRLGNEVKDGMDISLCIINPKNRVVQWSGANNPLYYIQHNEIFEIAPDKQPIGMHDGPKPFTTHTIHLQRGDSLYLFTDGYADQFGGPKEKKFSRKQFKDTLLALHNKTMTEQGAALYHAHMDWKNATPQVDDILVLGIRL
jgi:serine phosphatase RsbU (regulator of sigma subunit)